MIRFKTHLPIFQYKNIVGDNDDNLYISGDPVTGGFSSNKSVAGCFCFDEVMISSSSHCLDISKQMNAVSQFIWSVIEKLK